MTALMIDAATTRDRDDALTVAAVEDGWTATVYIADVASTVKIGSDTDRAAFAAGASKYLPQRTITMLGAALESTITLTDAADRAALAVHMRFDCAGELLDADIAPAFLAAGECVALTHTQVSVALTDSNDTHHHQLVTAHDLATRLIALRRARGAFAFYDARRGVLTDEDGSLVTVPSGHTAGAYLIVQELMVAANSVIAQWAITHDLPILFRNHQRGAVTPSAADLLAEVTGELNAAALNTAGQLANLTHRINQTLRRAQYSPYAVGHYGLQLDAYCHATSPLRRYPDLVTQRIIFAELAGGPSPYMVDELVDLSETINARIAAKKDSMAQVASKTRRREAAAAIANNDLTDIAGRDWQRVLRVAVASLPAPQVVSELMRRATDGSVSPGHLAIVLASEISEWRQAAAQVIDIVKTGTPEHAAAVISAWQQVDGGQTCSPQFDRLQHGPSHQPTFTVRARLDTRRTHWHEGSTRKGADQAALWELVEIIGGVTYSAPDIPPPEAPRIINASDPAVPDDQSGDRAWLRALRTAVRREPPQAMVADVFRRTDDGVLEPAQIAVLLDADDQAWQPIVWKVLAAHRNSHPHYAPTILSAWRQLGGATKASPEVVVEQVGDLHRPQFIARAVYGDHVSPWATASSKRAAQRNALWNLLEVITGKRATACVDDQPPLPSATPPSTPLPAMRGERTARAPRSVAAVLQTAPALAQTEVPDPIASCPVLRSALGATPDERARKYKAALKNPAAWLNSFAAQVKTPPPVVSTKVADRQCTVTIIMNTSHADVTAAATGTTAKVARTLASIDAIVAIFHPER